MATTILVSTLPVKVAAAFECNRLPRHGHLLNRHTLPLPDANRRRLGYSSSRSRGIQVPKSQKKDDEGGVADPKPFYAALEFWIQVAVVVLTFGFVDAGYSGDWSRIGALSPETEAQLRTAAYFVVPSSAAVVWAIGKREDM